jgi:hypothetical protein
MIAAGAVMKSPIVRPGVGMKLCAPNSRRKISRSLSPSFRTRLS